MMSNFWLDWASLFTILFLGCMVWAVAALYRTNKQAQRNKTLGSFDGIKENDAPIPSILFFGYLTFFMGAFVYLVLFPGIASWKGVINWTGENDSVTGHVKNLDKEIAQILDKPTNTPLTALSSNQDIVKAGESLFMDNCAGCHSESAKGQYHYPNLTDSDWLYGGNDKHIIISITHGRHGMMPVWEAHLTPAQLNEVTDYVMNINTEKKVDAVFAENCTSCHGADGKGNKAVGAPDLTDDVWLHGGSREEVYTSIAKGLNNQMPAFNNRLTQNQILQVGTYLRSIQDDYPVEVSDPVRITSTNSDGPSLPDSAASCVACHGKNGKSTGPAFPNLAGLSAQYIENQLNNFKRRKRVNATMSSMVAPLSDKDIIDIATYYSKQTAPLETVLPRGAVVVYDEPAARLVNQGDWHRGIPSCVTCHGTATLGVDSFPRLAGQNAKYIENQLIAWQQSKRTGDHDNMMKNVATKLTKEEVQAVAIYLSKMK